jgi:hypothetical protein
VDRRRRVGERFLQQCAAFREGPSREVVVAERQQVEGDEAGGRLLGQQVHAARCGVDALLEGVEVEGVAGGVGHNDLAVDHGALGKVRLDRGDDLGEVAGHRPLVPAADLHIVAVAEDDRAEPVPLGFVHLTCGDAADRLGQHRRDGRHDRELHARKSAA